MRFGLVSALSLLLLFMAGCSQQGTSPLPQLPACGNGTIELGEECDTSSCPEEKICTSECKCVSSVPPQLPEE